MRMMEPRPNPQTWSVLRWITEDEGLRALARTCRDYTHFREELRELGRALVFNRALEYPDYEAFRLQQIEAGDDMAYQTPDGVAWNDSALDLEQIADALTRLRADAAWTPRGRGDDEARL